MRSNPCKCEPLQNWTGFGQNNKQTKSNIKTQNIQKPVWGPFGLCCWWGSFHDSVKREIPVRNHWIRIYWQGCSELNQARDSSLHTGVKDCTNISNSQHGPICEYLNIGSGAMNISDRACYKLFSKPIHLRKNLKSRNNNNKNLQRTPGRLGLQITDVPIVFVAVARQPQ